MSRIHELVVRGGTVFGAGHSEIADVAIDVGTITSVGGHPSGRRVIDASGCLVLPGGIDGHVHLTPLPTSGAYQRPDDFVSGSRAALRGGVTTIGNMTHQTRGQGLIETLESVRAEAERHSLVDFLLHPVLNEPNREAIADISYLREHGYASLKLFMVFEEFEHQIDDYLDAMTLAAAHDVLVLVHCEDPAIIRYMQSRLASSGDHSVTNYAHSRPEESEIAAVERALAMGKTTGSSILLVHLSSHEALSRCIEARRKGVSVHVETRPLYLHFTESVFRWQDAAKYVGNPPPRSEQNRQMLWRDLASGAIDIIASDHAPWTLEQKLESGSDLRTALPGVSDLETMLPMLFSEGVVAGRISIERFVEVAARVPSEIYGLGQRKGAIQAGYDADIAIWDPKRQWTVQGHKMESKAGYSPYDGWKVTGMPIYCISRGKVLAEPDGIANTHSHRGQLAAVAPSGNSAAGQ